MFDWIKYRLRTREDKRTVLLQRAEHALRGGAPEQAREICLAILKRSPDEPHALSLMANVAADLRQVEEGLRWAKLATAVIPGPPRPTIPPVGSGSWPASRTGPRPVIAA